MGKETYANGDVRGLGRGDNEDTGDDHGLATVSFCGRSRAARL